MRGLPDVGDDFGSYHIDAVLGRGAMGTVYTATQRRLSRTEALKVLSPSWIDADDYRQRFVREAETLARLDSPHIIHIYDYGDVDGTPYISTQLIRGGDLSRFIRDRGPLAAPLALRIAAQVASALEDAHGTGVIHRDVKPSNVLLRQDAEPFAYLCDFGIARTETGGLTTTGTVVGTWAYLAPERCNGREASAASDVYSVGCLLWAMLTGDAPYTGTDVSVAMAHVHDPIPQLPDMDERTRRLNEVLRRAMAKAPGDRFSSASDLRSALVSLTAADVRQQSPLPAGNGDETQIRLPTPPLPVPPPPRRNRRRLGLAALVALAVLLVGAIGAAAVLLGNGPSNSATGTGSATGPASSTPWASRSPVAVTQTAKQLKKLTRVSYDGGDRSQLAIQSFADEPNGAVRIFGLGPDGSVSMTDAGDLPSEPTPNIHRMNGDFDGDGTADAAIFADDGDGGQTVSVSTSTSQGFAAPSTWGHVSDLGDDSFSTVTGDFDGNGMMDIAVMAYPGGAGSIQIDVLLSNGSGLGRPQPWTEQLPWNDKTVKLEPGDVNGDGRTDLVAVRGVSGGTEILTMLATDHHAFEFPTDWIAGGALPLAFSHVKAMVGDFDGGTVADLMLFESTGDPDAPGVQAVFMRSERDGFDAGQQQWTSADWVLGDLWVSVGDFDADGRADVGCIRGTTEGVDVQFLLSRGSTLQLQDGVASWSGHSHDQTRTLNVIG